MAYVYLCTGAFLYVPYSILLTSRKRRFFRKKFVYKFGHRIISFNHKRFDKSPQCHGGSSWSNVALTGSVQVLLGALYSLTGAMAPVREYNAWRFTLEHEKLSLEPWRLDLEH
jgi:hypothetical protein